MRVTRIGAIGMAVAAMVVGSGAGLAAASSSPAVTGNEHFALMTTQPSARHYVVIANGLFTAPGIDYVGATTDLVKLPLGTFRVHHGGRVTVLKETLNPLTCLATFVAKTNITINNGTGAYRGIVGFGTATISSLAIYGRNLAHQCAVHKNPIALEQTINANAKISL